MKNREIESMKKEVSILFIVLISGLLYNQSFGQKNNNNKYSNPERFEEAIQKFESADTNEPPPRNAIVCVGSSSMRGWHEKIRDDLAPLTIIARGFGGSNMNDLLFYADRIVIPYKPRAIVVYEGDNDIAQGITPVKIADTFNKFVIKIHNVLPECRIYFLSVKPSIDRWDMWTKMQAANTIISQICAENKLLTYIDISSGMLNKKGVPREDIFLDDNLHMTRDGYLIWKEALRPVLINKELQFENTRSN